MIDMRTAGDGSPGSALRRAAAVARQGLHHRCRVDTRTGHRGNDRDVRADPGCAAAAAAGPGTGPAYPLLERSAHGGLGVLPVRGCRDRSYRTRQSTARERGWCDPQWRPACGRERRHCVVVRQCRLDHRGLLRGAWRAGCARTPFHPDRRSRRCGARRRYQPRLLAASLRRRAGRRRPADNHQRTAVASSSVSCLPISTTRVASISGGRRDRFRPMVPSVSRRSARSI